MVHLNFRHGFLCFSQLGLSLLIYQMLSCFRPTIIDLALSVLHEGSTGVSLPQVDRQAPLIHLLEYLSIQKASVVNVTVENMHI